MTHNNRECLVVIHFFRVQVIKAYRVQSKDTLTLVVEVISQPAATFEWFLNDQPLTIPPPNNESGGGAGRYRVRHAGNVSTLTVEAPEQGVYSCAARNPAGVSKSYGYITVDDSQSYKLGSSSEEEMSLTLPPPQARPQAEERGRRKRRRVPPKFLSQVPHLVLRAGEEALIDVEVESGDLPVRYV